ncbi:hypothetical protein [Carbonactinospora thermoautotrophica]|uniref:hypothetical protein n=1 Tax=Carbonactinospora thermoautotrophica TaxID=1469144 RepID=UPI001146E458|nr:hypothetical protein [Carbonactinospora thermoautotrophica]
MCDLRGTGPYLDRLSGEGEVVVGVALGTGVQVATGRGGSCEIGFGPRESAQPDSSRMSSVDTPSAARLPAMTSPERRVTRQCNRQPTA